MFRFFTLSLLAAASVAVAADDVTISAARKDDAGLLVHEVQSPYQSQTTRVRVLLPDRIDPARRYPVLYVLPVEANDTERWGQCRREVLEHDLHNRHGLICVFPTFSDLPWYADHPTDPKLRQESYFVKVVVPQVDRLYPTKATCEGRLLLGFSKSGWGAFSLLLRHPDVFGRAVAWDAPLMMEHPDKYGMGGIFGTQENFEKYQITALLKDRAKTLSGEPRLAHFGYGNFREHHQSAHRLMDDLGIPHTYRDGPNREHSWHSGWLSEAVEMLVR